MPASDVRVGDAVFDRGTYRTVVKIRNAQGRKPQTGYNLHLLTDERMVRIHSAREIAVRRPIDTDGD